jgi:hypothetical protein
MPHVSLHSLQLLRAPAVEGTPARIAQALWSAVVVSCRSVTNIRHTALLDAGVGGYHFLLLDFNSPEGCLTPFALTATNHILLFNYG